jgi:hypothetical protein
MNILYQLVDRQSKSLKQQVYPGPAAEERGEA